MDMVVCVCTISALCSEVALMVSEFLVLHFFCLVAGETVWLLVFFDAAWVRIL